MNDYQDLIIEALCNQHHKKEFYCANLALDSYLKTQAKQDVKRRVSRVFVATRSSEPNIIVGYYTLSSLSIELSHLPQTVAAKLPKHPIPAAFIGRLAVSQPAQGQGIGKMLLADAIKRTLAVSSQIAIYAMVVDAIDEDATRFYQKFGFSYLNSYLNSYPDTDNQRLFLPLKVVSTITT
jgi:GNAT superfamily N-acetyltransferase